MFFFFFQAEDGIRDIGVTGVQTCALPIYTSNRRECHPSGHFLPVRDTPCCKAHGKSLSFQAPDDRPLLRIPGGCRPHPPDRKDDTLSTSDAPPPSGHVYGNLPTPCSPEPTMPPPTMPVCADKSYIRHVRA